MSSKIISSSELFLFLECLGFEATDILDSAGDQLRFVHPEKKCINSNRNWIIVPTYKRLAGRMLEKLLNHLDEFDFPSSIVKTCSDRHISFI